jgi:hypothetical protein
MELVRLFERDVMEARLAALERRSADLTGLETKLADLENEVLVVAEAALRRVPDRVEITASTLVWSVAGMGPYTTLCPCVVDVREETVKGHLTQGAGWRGGFCRTGRNTSRSRRRS